MLKKIICILLCCVTVCASLPTAYATEKLTIDPIEEIQPYYEILMTKNADLSITDGLATCSATIAASGTVTSMLLTMYLEKKTLWWWNEVTHWNQVYSDPSGSCIRTYAASGGTFRLRVVVTVTTNGTSEEVTFYSSEVKG